MFRSSFYIRAFLIWITACLAFGCANPRPQFAHEDVNVLMIVIDTLRQDHLGIYGYPQVTSPVIDELGREGAVLDGLSPTSWTKSATASLLTALHPLQHQAYGRNDALPESAVTLAEILHDHGYQTIAVSGNGWVGEKFGFKQGFDEFYQVRGKKGAGSGTADLINAATLPVLDSLRRPYFLYLHYIDPHAPYSPPHACGGSPLDEPLAELVPLHSTTLQPGSFKTRPEELMQALIELYDSEICFADQAIGELLHALEKRGLMESTLTIVTSDHGEELEEHQRIGHGRTLYKEVTRVPLILNAPGVIPPEVRIGTTNLMDVMPTVLDLLGLEQPQRPRPRGISIADSLFGGTDQQRRTHLLHLDVDAFSTLGLVEGNSKLVLSRNPHRKEVFDVPTDTYEKNNLFNRDPDQSRQLVRTVAETYNKLRKEALRRRFHSAKEETKKELAALGYVEPSEEVEPRWIPHRVREADAHLYGTLGWENYSLIQRCVGGLTEGESDDALLRGWFRSNADGRWMEPRASALINLPDGTGEKILRIQGRRRRKPEKVNLQIYLGGREARPPTALGGGSFAVDLPLRQKTAAGPTLLELRTTPASEASVKPGDLNLFISSICIDAGGAGPP